MKVVGAIIFKNEESFFLERVLRDALIFLDEVVAIDDYSTDKSGELARSLGVYVYTNNGPSFIENQYLLKTQVLRLAVERGAQWILSFDADEIFEERFKQNIPSIIASDKKFVNFKCAHMWDDKITIYDIR